MGQITALAMPDTGLIQRFAEQAPQIGAAFDQALQASRKQQIERYQLGQQLQQAQQQKAAQQAYIANPNAENLNTLITLNPQAAQAIKTGHDALDLQTQRDQLRQATYVRGLIAAGKPDQAIAALTQRADTDDAAGHDSSGDRHMIELIKADPKQAGAAIDYHLAAILGPEKFGDNFKTLGDSRRSDAEEPGKIALTAAQAKQAEASAAKDRFLVVGDQAYPIQAGGPPAEAAPAAAPAASTPATIPGPAGQAVTAAATKVGATPEDIDFLARTAALESQGHPGAQNGSSTGVFQMQPKTFSGLGGTDINDVGQQTVATLKNARQNAKAMKGMIGRQPTPAEVYIGHQQGATGASALIANPDQNAIAALTQAGVSPAKARASILGNGGTADMTAGQFVQKWGDAYTKAAGGAPADGAPNDSAPAGVATDAQGNAYRLGSPVGASADSENRLTPEAVDYVAQQYIATGQLPPMGMGKSATANRNAVLNRAQQIEAETGATGYDAVARHATMKTAQATLTQASKTLSAVQAAEGTVEQNMGIVMRLAPKGAGPTGSPMLNAPIQSLRKNVWGSKDVAAFDGALGTVADEYGKVMTTSTGTGGQALSDSARQEAYSRLSKAATIGQLQATMSTMRQEMASRSAELSKQRTEQLAILSNRGAAPQGAPAAAAAPAASGPRLSPAQAQALKPGTPFIGLDGVPRVRH